MADAPKMPEPVLQGPQGIVLKSWGPSQELSAVGKPLPKRGAYEKVTGRAQFTYDLYLPGMLYATILRSSQAHAHILDIDTAAAEKVPGVRAILSYKNAPAIRWDEERNLFNDQVRFVGEEVAAVAAEDDAIIETALGLIRVRYDPLPAVIEPEEAMKPGTVQLQPGGNIWKGAPEVYQRGNVERGFAEADIVYEQNYTTAVQHHVTMETHGCVASWDGDNLTLWDSTQGIHWVRDFMAMRLRMPIHQIRVLSQYTGGGFGSKNGIQPYHVITALLAKRTGRPVRYFAGRGAEFVVSHHRPKTIQYYKAGVKRDGTLTAVYSKIIGQAGPYKENAMWALRAGTYEASKKLFNCPNVKVEAYAVHTNTQSPIPNRGPGRTENLFALEQFIDELAEKVGMDPIKFRMKNYAERDPVKNLPYSSNGLAQCYQQGAEAFRWEARKPGSVGSGPQKRGIGMGTALWPGASTEQSQALVIIQNDGTAQVLAGIANIGVGAETIFAQIAAEELGIKPENITVSYGDTATNPYTINSSYGSRTTFFSGPAIRNAAADAKRQLLAMAAASLEAPASELDIKDGRIFVKSNAAKGIPLTDITKKVGRELIIGTGKRPANPAGYEIEIFGAHFAEVEVDTETGQVKLLRAVCAHDCGRWINPLTAESQIQGGFLFGAGMALTEERIMDKRYGIQLNRNLHEYGILTSLDVPDTLQALDPEVLDISNNINAKGLGEPPTTGAGGAIANAIYNAIGVRIRDYPITPNKILAALEKEG